MAGRIRRAFTLIELLVVLAIIAMILALAAPAVMSILKTTTLSAATDVLRSAVTTTRSTAVSSRKSCSVDIRNIVDPSGRVFTDSVSTSAILTAEDFEPYDDGRAEIPPAAGSLPFTNNWVFFPVQDAWEIYTQRTRELWVGRRIDSDTKPYSGNAYAWNVTARTSDEPAVDVETMVLARFRARQVTDSKRAWGFGLLSNFTNTARQCFGYRFAVRMETTDAGWNTFSRAQLERIDSPSNPSNENFYDASDAGLPVGATAARDLDEPDEEISCALTPGVWYWMKLRMNRVQKVVTLAGKIWVEGSPEPVSWTVGPVQDVWSGVEGVDNFGSGPEPLAGGFSGVWSRGAEVAVDDFSVDWRNTWPLPKGIYMQPMGVDMTDPAAPVYFALDRYAPGSFPLSYRPDGTAASDRSVLLVITNTASGHERVVLIDRNTGRVEAADNLESIK